MSEWVRRQPRLSSVFAEQPLPERTALDRWVGASLQQGKALVRRLTGRRERLVRRVERRADALAEQSEHVLHTLREERCADLRLRGVRDDTLIDTFALIMITSHRVLGMRHHPTQVRAGLSLLSGRIAEMATGEGKSLAATLAAGTAGLAGIPVHVVTVNDYLAERDAREMAPLYQALGLTVGAVTHELDPQARREVYQRDVVYCANKELVFDYLKDQLALQGRVTPAARFLARSVSATASPMQRGLHFAIVDEADSVFVDEARTPLIISGQERLDEEEAVLLEQALQVARQMQESRHFELDERRGLRLTGEGEALAAEYVAPWGGLWRNAEYQEALVTQALTALHRFVRDRDYLIDQENQVQIIDPHTGRVMPGRSWSQGLHQLVELKEGLAVTKPRETRAEISYQNFFRKYCALAGMTGTAVEVRRELADIYSLACDVVAPLIPPRRKTAVRAVCSNAQRRNQYVAEYVARLHATGQPVLVGTSSVATSEQIASLLAEAGVAHSVLNARQDKSEADVVAGAGRHGAVTIATSMAGRGTDIKLDELARRAGGLHVIVTELSVASRVDRQLAGRAARQGDPGAVSYILAGDDVVVRRAGGGLHKAMKWLMWPLGNGGRFLWLRWGQRRIERIHYRQRMQLVKSDTRRQRMLSFSAGQRGS